MSERFARNFHKVCFEESDGITVIGHTPEKDAFIGLMLALDMTLTLKKPLGAYLHEIEERYGYIIRPRTARSSRSRVKRCSRL